MAQPVIIDLPHNLGLEEAKRRMKNRIGKLPDHIPGGGQVESDWSGDRMNLRVTAMGQEVSGHIDVYDRKVTLELALPAFLALFADKIAGVIRKRGTEMLEDKSDKA
jgi:Putative polyhydroxyalkanoic acid system protein (PHA_gran_rgn)